MVTELAAHLKIATYTEFTFIVKRATRTKCATTVKLAISIKEAFVSKMSNSEFIDWPSINVSLCQNLIHIRSFLFAPLARGLFYYFLKCSMRAFTSASLRMRHWWPSSVWPALPMLWV